MPASDYYFITHWRVNADPREVIDVLGNAEDLPHHPPRRMNRGNG